MNNRLYQLLLFLFAMAISTLQAATITVNSDEDVVNDDGNCTLREAIEAANTNSAVDACVAGSGGKDVIQFMRGKDYSISLNEGALMINESLTIDGKKAKVFLDASGRSRIFIISAPTTIKHLNLNDGQAADCGGAIYSSANLLINDSILSNNRVTNGEEGGAICMVAGDSSNVHKDANLTVNNVTFRDNHANKGGAIYARAYAVVVGGSASANVIINNSTLVDNTVDDNGNGSVIYADASSTTSANVTISNSTIAQNSTNVEAIFTKDTPRASAALTLHSSILLGNKQADLGLNCNRPAAAGANNLLGDDSCGNNIGTTNAVLQNVLDSYLRDGVAKVSLGYNGCVHHCEIEPWTVKLAENSPAINTGSDIGYSSLGNQIALTTDQRGVVFLDAPDIGAYEAVKTGRITVNSAQDDNGNGCTLREAVSLANDNSLDALNGCQREANIYARAVDRIIFAEDMSIDLENDEIFITDPIEIDGGDKAITIDAKQQSRIFGATTFATLENLVLTGGQCGDGVNCHALNAGLSNNGGAIATTEDLIIRNSFVTDHTASSGGGGAVYAFSALGIDVDIENSEFADNSAGTGGAVLARANLGNATMNINQSSFLNNRAVDGSGGGVALDASTSTVSVVNSTFWRNKSIDGSGGAILTKSAEVNNSTFVENSASKASAIYALSQATINNSILLGNVGRVTPFSPPAHIPDCFSFNPVSGDNNVFQTGANCGSGSESTLVATLVTASGKTTPKDHGCRHRAGVNCVKTIKLVSDSLAINQAGDDAIVTDQRGFGGFHDQERDIGAFELRFYTLYYQSNGSENAPDPSEIKVAEGESITLSPGLSREGFNFIGWNTEANGTGEQYDAGDTFVVDADKQFLYAQWQEVRGNCGSAHDIATRLKPVANLCAIGTASEVITSNVNYTWNCSGSAEVCTAPRQYTLSYDANGGNNPPDSINRSANQLIELAPKLSRDDFVFIGWNTQVDGSGTQYSSRATVAMPSADTTLYAQWQARGNCGNAHGAATVLPPGFNLCRIGFPSRVTNGVSAYSWTCGGAQPLCEAPRQYVIIYERNDGINNIPNSILEVPGNVVAIAPAIKRDNYTFTGWNTQADGSGAPYVAGSNIAMPSNSLTLYAQWVEIVVEAGRIFEDSFE